MPSISPETSVKISSFLKNMGKINDQILAEAQKEFGSNGKTPLGMIDYFLTTNKITEDDLVSAISRNYALRKINLTEANIKQDALTKLPADFIISNEVLPFEVEGKTLKIAIIDPTKNMLVGKLKTMTGYNIEMYVAKPSNFESIFKSKAYSGNSSQVSNSTSRPTSAYKSTARAVGNDESSVVNFVDEVLRDAYLLGASDIHIEHFRHGEARMRFRKDGILIVQDKFTRFLEDNYNAIITRLKIISGCDISEKRLPQDGQLQFKNPAPKSLDDEEIDVRFNVLPSKNGERVVMRILAGSPDLSLDQVGFQPEDYKKLINAIESPQGMVLVTGPTGSGKSTTLYACIKKINKPGINILTAEDPVEHYLPGIGQVQANNEIGLTFPEILRSFLRQDPEVILVGEIRDKETVDIAVKAALTGHLLLSTLHTNDSVSTITRLTSMGVPSFMVASSLSLIVAQRLTRKNCPQCTTIDEKVTPTMLLDIGFSQQEVSTFRPRRGAGCQNCNNTGYKGRKGIYEVLKKTPALEQEILRDARTTELLAAAKKDGFVTMQEIGRDLMKNGTLSFEEYQRTLVISG
jgi:type IV pilus assembly protein PilB